METLKSGKEREGFYDKVEDVSLVGTYLENVHISPVPEGDVLGEVMLCCVLPTTENHQCGVGALGK